jgi:hypothetical protein
MAFERFSRLMTDESIDTKKGHRMSMSEQKHDGDNFLPGRITSPIKRNK